MKHEQLRTILTAAILAFVTAWGTGGCLVSAFGLSLEYPFTPVLVCGCAAALVSVLFSFRRGSILFLCLLALAGGYIHQNGTAAQQFFQLFQRLSTVYDRAYGWGVLQLTENAWDAGFADWPVCLICVLTAASAAWCICRQKSVWLPVLVTLLPLSSCIVVTDTVPGEAWLFLVMTGLILLILTSAVRRENAQQGLRLTAVAALPVILALAGLFLAISQKSYVNQTALLRENILIAAENLPSLLDAGANQLASKLRSQSLKQIDLASLGARIPFTYPVMDVTAESDGPLYLREQDFDRYDGLGWHASEDRQEPFFRSSSPSEVVLITCRNRKDFCFLPYYPQSETLLQGGCLENTGRETTFSVRRSPLPANWRQAAYEHTAALPEDYREYLTLPDRTRQNALKYLEGLYPPDASCTEIADMIAALVTNSARYDLNTGKMPEGEPDFALWFLRDGETGYCVHFATAATVLLRSAGVPARYVTGYLLDARSGQAVTVTEENAHAWAEYYEPNLGLWIPLEATPAAETRPEPTVSRPVQTVPTLPPETQPRPTEAITEATLPTSQTEQVPPSSSSADSEEKSGIPTILVLLPALVLVVMLQRSVRLSLRRRQQRTGSSNQQALRRWRESVRLSRLLKETPTEELMALAQKAKFSQYTLSDEELGQFDSFNRSCLRRLKKKPWHLRLVYQFIYAAY